MQPVNLYQALASVADHWSPKAVGRFNGHEIMVVKAAGEFVWHAHAHTDDFFLVLDGRMTVRTERGDAELGPGDLFVVEQGVRHCPVAHGEVHLLLIEPAGTPNTGDPQTATQTSEL